jgi:imidazolonepropionase-like amidohydrolase
MNIKISLFTALFLISLPFTLPAEEALLLQNAHIITVSGATIERGDLLIQNGKIAAVGTDLKASGARVIDLKGQWLMPGIIDSHAHIAIEGGVNEMGNLMTPETDIAEVIYPEDINIWYALTGGVTSVHTMHGSANPIGGRGIVLKLRWGQNARAMIFKGAPKTVKWALGENPKQSNMRMFGAPRYPRSRMGVEASIREIFEQAKTYKQKWSEFAQKKKNSKGIQPNPPRRDYRLEVVSQILDGQYWIRCHAYQATEMLSIMKLCHEYGVKLAAFEHGLEGYRIADELKKYKVAVTTFADFWAFKWEAYFTMPHAAALMNQRGVLTALNSDDPERMRHLFSEAAKTVRFGRMNEAEAIKAITLNPAIINGVDRYVGTIEVGKDADLAVFNRHPLDPFTVCQMTLVDGQILFDRAQYLEEQKKMAAAAQESKAKKEAAPKETAKPKEGA